MRKGLTCDESGVTRCWWPGQDGPYTQYHDSEWGRPVHNDTRLFEKVCLEGFQSGLSWLTILRKRQNFREAFDDFEPERVVRFTARRVEKLLQNAGIVRHRGKIESTINNALHALELQEQWGSLAAYFWQFEPPSKERPTTCTHAALTQMSITPTSTRLSKELKRQGWSYVGPTTCYAFMQAMGLVNDHVAGCDFRPQVEALRAKFRRPVRDL